MKYFGKLKTAMKYLKTIAKAYPEFDGNPPPMTVSKQEHIVSTLPPLFQFMKDKCLSKFRILRPNLPVYEFYNIYTEYCESKGIKPLAKVAVSRTLSNELGIVSTRPYINGDRVRAYNITYDELYKK